jgi:outer membrane protein OmpA-like peptidoglycan-associated protein/Tol biopolymer transport system component
MKQVLLVFQLVLVFFLNSTIAFAQGESPIPNLQKLVEEALKTKKVVTEVSSEFIDYAPSVSADGKTMILETNRTGRWELFISKRGKDGKWETPVPIKVISDYGDSTDLIGGPTISYDGNIIYFFGSFSAGIGDNDIYYSVREEDGWSTPKNIGAPINTVAYEGFPSISADGKTLYFIRSVDTQNFCTKIYRSKKGPDGKWQEPEELPYPVNLDCERSPRIMADNKTLIFSSERAGGKGGYDLYQTQLQEDDEWTVPVPLDYVNTTDNEQFPGISASGELLYYNDSKNILSIVIPEPFRQFKNVIIQGKVTDADNQDPLEVNIRISNAQTSELIYEVKNNASDGRYSVVLAVGSSYNVEFQRNRYSTGRFSYDLRTTENYNEFEQNVELYSTVNLNMIITDVELFEPVESSIKISNKKTGAMVKELKNDPEGRGSVGLAIGEIYEVLIKANNYDDVNFDFDLSKIVLYRDYERDIELNPHKVKMKINVSDVTNNGKIQASVVLKNKRRDEQLLVDSDGMVSLRIGDKYELEASTDRGYSFTSSEIDLSDPAKALAVGKKSLEESLDLKLIPLKNNTNLVLRDIVFESNSATLSDDSYDELNRVIKLMKSNPSMRVEISAHTDDIGSDGYNVILSDKRAKSVMDFLIQNEIQPSKFISKGYGKSKPIVPNINDENRAKNRRVELKILEI